ncbi:MAG: GGDEF domain-containing protein [Actinobacteria bacterium]|nr:GGDEF domain-containing protein [Actinomycetota bacterium]
MKSKWLSWSQPKKAALKIGLVVAATLCMLAVSIYRVPGITAVMMLICSGILACFSIVYPGRLRYLVLILFTGIIAVELFLHQGLGTLTNLSILLRFLLASFLVTLSGDVIFNVTQKLYTDTKRLANEKEQALARMNALFGVINAINTRYNLNEIFKESLEEARRVFHADSGIIYSVNQETGKLSIVSSFGYSDKLLEKMKEKGISHISSCDACTRGDTIIVENLSTDDKCPNLAKVDSGSSVCIPITSKNSLRGVLHLRRSEVEAFSEEDIQLATAMTYQFGVAMQRASLFDQLNTLAITDPLTGLYNLRRLNRDLGREIQRSGLYHRPFSIIMSDIDHFKQLNDTFGHQAGDEIIRIVARALNKSTRDVDLVYRYGGDEFTILMPETDGEQAVEAAERYLHEISSLKVAIDDYTQPIGVTISIGLVSFTRETFEPEELIAQADRALYIAKATGRNKVIVYSEIGCGGADEGFPCDEKTPGAAEGARKRAVDE